MAKIKLTIFCCQIFGRFGFKKKTVQIGLDRFFPMLQQKHICIQTSRYHAYANPKTCGRFTDANLSPTHRLNSEGPCEKIHQRKVDYHSGQFKRILNLNDQAILGRIPLLFTTLWGDLGGLVAINCLDHLNERNPGSTMLVPLPKKQLSIGQCRGDT